MPDLAVALSFPPHTLQVLDVTHIWSGSGSDVMRPDDILALAASVYMFIKLHLSTQQRYPRTLHELCTAFSALFTRQQPAHDPVLHTLGIRVSESSTSSSGCWRSWVLNWQPSRRWLGSSSSAGGSAATERLFQSAPTSSPN